jgi:SNF2 family DNA or RNA helicase
MSKTAFEDRYCEKSNIRSNGRTIEIITGSKNVKELKTRLNGFFIRKTKDEVLKDLPPLRFVTHPVQIDNPEYFATVSQLVESGYTEKEILKHAAMMNNSTRYAELGMAKAPAAAELVHDLLDGGMGQIVLWAIHTPVIDYLVKHLLDVGVSRLDGGVSQRDRDKGIELFVEGKHRVFVGHIEAGGTAITLSGGKLKCSDTLFVESHFSPKMNWQAACRIHRIGQQDAVLARFLSAVGTYDERLQEIQARKTQDFADLFDDENTI